MHEQGGSAGEVRFEKEMVDGRVRRNARLLERIDRSSDAREEVKNEVLDRCICNRRADWVRRRLGLRVAKCVCLVWWCPGLGVTGPLGGSELSLRWGAVPSGQSEAWSRKPPSLP